MNFHEANIATLELRRLLFELKDIRSDICIRFRLIGELWQNNFHHVAKLTDEGAVLMEERTNKLFFVKDLKNIIQFEIDKPFQNYKPHYHYNVDPLVVDLKTKAV
jgi:hypothetical protein